MEETTAGGLLGGSVAYRQFAEGHRSGFEPVLLAAAIQARPGERVLEAGTGAGAGLLCLAARIPGVFGLGVERDAATARLAQSNFNANAFANLFCVQADATALPLAPQSFDHVFANPPWFDVAGTASPNARRSLAHQAKPGLLEGWIASLTRTLRPRGSITLILPASAFATAGAALRAHHCGGITLFPLWPRANQPAKMAILTARAQIKTPDAIAPGLILHDSGGITPEAQSILRDGAEITFSS
jgi:tRNA1(Val) A37 N6-methylase TrmN6